jgi:hypothetical protein
MNDQLLSLARRSLPVAAAVLATALLSGCSALGALSTVGLLKAGSASLASAALERTPGRASDTVHHGDAPVSTVCIEFNRNAQLADLVPALQAELREQRVASRVYEPGTDLQTCEVWLRYVATIQWGIPPLSTQYRAYLSAASISLQKADGRLIASSHYRMDDALEISKWADTRHKLARVVKAVVTGFES